MGKQLSCVGVICAVALVVHAQPGGKPGAPPPALVGVGDVRMEELQARRDVVGRLREIRRTIVAAEQPGRVVEIPVDEGDEIAARKTVLAKIDDVWARLALQSARSRLEQARATVAEAQARLEQASRDRKYLDELLEAASAKPKEVEDAHTTEQAEKARLKRAQADLMVAQAELDLRKEELVRLTVLAPFDGMVVQKMTEVGQWVNQGDGVVEIISRGGIDGVIDVPEQIINHIQVGAKVEVMIEPLGFRLMGQIVVINPSGSTSARTFPVKIRLDDRGGLLKPGMSILAKIPITQRIEVLTVPRDAIQRSAMGTVVWMDADGVATPISVEVLFGHGDRYAISLLQAGAVPLTDHTNVVTEGAERLFPGRPLSILATPIGESDQPNQENISN